MREGVEERRDHQDYRSWCSSGHDDRKDEVERLGLGPRGLGLTSRQHCQRITILLLEDGNQDVGLIMRLSRPEACASEFLGFSAEKGGATRRE